MQKTTRCKLELIISLAFLLLVAFAASALADEYAAKERELAEVKQAQQQAQALLADLSKAETAIMAELRQLEQDLVQAKQELATVEQHRQRTTASIAEVEKEVKAATSRYEESQAKLDTVMARYNVRLRQLYMASGTDMLDLLFAPGAAGDVVMRMKLFSALLQQDVVLYQEVVTQKANTDLERDRLNNELKRLQQEQARLGDLQQQAQKQVEQVSRAKTERDQKLKQILQQKSTQQQAIQEFTANSKKIQAWLEARKNAPPVNNAAGQTKFSRPVTAVVTSQFGWRLDPMDKVNRFHEGLDFGAAEGTPIKAAAEGRVVLAGWVGGYGYTIIVEHADGYSTLYGHASRLLAEVGDLVARGQVIAEVGNTGISTAPHLHFEIRRAGQPVNPSEYLGE